MIKQVIVIRRDLKMRRGKEIAQGAHASMAFLLSRMDFIDNYGRVVLTEEQRRWLLGTRTKVTVTVPSEEDLWRLLDQARKLGLPAEMVQDLGKTEFHGSPTYTALAVGPAEEELVDQVTGSLPLY